MATANVIRVGVAGRLRGGHQELDDDSRVISVALVDDKFEVLSGEKDIFLPGSTNR